MSDSTALPASLVDEALCDGVDLMITTTATTGRMSFDQALMAVTAHCIAVCRANWGPEMTIGMLRECANQLGKPARRPAA